jgi:ankyrin repeat protein
MPRANPPPGSMNNHANLALFAAATAGDATALRLALAEGALVNSRGHYAWRALMHASWNGHPACLQALVEAGTDLGRRTTLGETALPSSRVAVSSLVAEP